MRELEQPASDPREAGCFVPGRLFGFERLANDREHRLTHRIKGDDIETVACRYHYDDR